MRCPAWRQQELEQNNNNADDDPVAVENIFAAQQPQEIIEIEN